jgi:hypothetical protein
MLALSPTPWQSPFSNTTHTIAAAKCALTVMGVVPVLVVEHQKPGVTEAVSWKLPSEEVALMPCWLALLKLTHSQLARCLQPAALCLLLIMKLHVPLS